MVDSKKKTDRALAPLKSKYPPDVQAAVDEEHLRLLALGHYIQGGIAALNMSFALIYAGFGAAMLINPHWFTGANTTAAEAITMGWVFLVIGLTVTGIGWTYGGLTAYSGRCIAQQKHRTFSLIMGLLNCMWMPLGTVLGVFTFITLGRPSVRELYSGESPLLVAQESVKPAPVEFDHKKLEVDLKKIDEDEEAMWREIEKKANGQPVDGARVRLKESEEM